MALNTKQRRGSAIGVSLPFRQWLAEPSGSLPLASRLSLLRYVASVSAAFGHLSGTALAKPSLLGKINARPSLTGKCLVNPR